MIPPEKDTGEPESQLDEEVDDLKDALSTVHIVSEENKAVPRPWVDAGDEILELVEASVNVSDGKGSVHGL